MKIDYFFALASPFTYMGHARFMAMAEQAGAEVAYRPANVMEIFSHTGGVPVKQRSPQRQAYRMMELNRWKAHLGLPMNVTPKFFPVVDAEAGKAVIAAIQAGHAPGKRVMGFLKAVWEQERDIADGGTIRRCYPAPEFLVGCPNAAIVPDPRCYAGPGEVQPEPSRPSNRVAPLERNRLLAIVTFSGSRFCSSPLPGSGTGS